MLNVTIMNDKEMNYLISSILDMEYVLFFFLIYIGGDRMWVLLILIYQQDQRDDFQVRVGNSFN